MRIMLPVLFLLYLLCISSAVYAAEQDTSADQTSDIYVEYEYGDLKEVIV
jgi:hypothetical protein